ncbi:MAG: hypothetical protein ABI696_09740 [Rubrivivax sp.]
MTTPNPDRHPSSPSPAATSQGNGRPARRQADDPATGRSVIDALECEANAMTPVIDPARAERRSGRSSGDNSNTNPRG